MAGKLFKDWFNRRVEDSFTFNNEERLFNWDEGRSRYSSYFMKDNNAMSEAAKIVGSMFRVMNVDKNAQYSSKDDLRDKKSIHLPLHLLKKDPDKDGKREFLDIDDPAIDSFYGSCIQNAALYSMQTESEYLKTITALRTDKRSGSTKDLFFSILNNERIEKKLSERFPGYLKLIQKMKDFKYDTNYTPVPDSAAEQVKLMDLVIRMLRYPAHITEDEMSKYGDVLKSIEKLIKKFGGMPKTSDECSSMAGSIATIINKYDPSEPPPSEEEKGESKGESGSDDTSTPSSSKMSKEELDEVAKNYIKSLLSDPDKHNKSGDDKDDFADFVDEMTPADDMTLDYNDEEGKKVSGSIEFVKVENNFEEYKDALKGIDVTKAGVLKKLFARKNKDYDFAIRSMRSGRLDTNKIAEAKQGVATIYERIGNIKTDKITVTVLIDESGSMNSDNRIGKAQQAAIFINEVFAGVPNVELFIYGHTADINGFDTTILVYKEPGHTSNKWSLGNVKARSQNRDGHAILAVAKRVRKHTQNAGIMLVMSDGQPCASRYSGHEGVKDTRKKATEAQKLGFQVIQVAIDEHVDSKEMFDHYIKMTNIKNLPIDMVNYLSRKVDRLVKERITL